MRLVQLLLELVHGTSILAALPAGLLLLPSVPAIARNADLLHVPEAKGFQANKNSPGLRNHCQKVRRVV
jgi:hypothetical protein